MKKLKKINYILHRLGLELNKYNTSTNDILRRQSLIKKYGVDLIIDVGANTGIYGIEMRKSGYKNRICSFEPLSTAFSKLKIEADKDSNWDVYNYALGENVEELEINISGNSHSSSILNIMESHTNAEPTSNYIGSEKIKVDKLDNIFENIKKYSKEIYLKIDTQGYESMVLNGSVNSLNKINTIQLEMSLKPLYHGQMLFDELYTFLKCNGYSLINIETGFVNPTTGELLQIDGFFRR